MNLPFIHQKQTPLDASGLVWFNELYSQYLRLRPRLVRVELTTGRLVGELPQTDQTSATIGDSIVRLKNEIEELKSKHQAFGAELSDEQKRQKNEIVSELQSKLQKILQAFAQKAQSTKLTEAEQVENSHFVAQTKLFILGSYPSKSPFKKGNADSQKDIPSSVLPPGAPTEPAQSASISAEKNKQADVPTPSTVSAPETPPPTVENKQRLPAEPPTEKVVPLVDERMNAMAALDALNPEKHPVLYQQHLFDLENWILVLLPRDDLRERLESVRGEYRDVFGTEAWVKILPSLQAELMTEKEAENRAEARRLQGELHWQASIRPWAAHKRETLTATVLVFLIVLILLAGVAKWAAGLDLAGVLLLAGAFGAAVGSIQRIQTADFANSRAFDLARHATLQIGVVIAPLLGGVFALVLALFIFSNSVPAGFIIPNVTVSCREARLCSDTNAVQVATGNAETNVTLVAESNHQPTTATNLPTGASKTGSLGATLATTNVALYSRNVSNQVGIALPNSSLTNGSAGTNGGVMTKEGAHPGKVGQPQGCKYEFFTLQVTFASGKDLVLMVLLAFVAGFSERLVPDLLTKLADQKKS